MVRLEAEHGHVSSSDVRLYKYFIPLPFLFHSFFLWCVADFHVHFIRERKEENKKKDRMPPKIAIIGAGPCGLTLAVLLERASIPYTIFERDASPEAVTTGGSLDIHPETGQRALREAGLFEGFQKVARYEDTVISISDKDGERVFSAGQGRDAPEIDRRELRALLLGGLPEGRVRWGFGLVGAVRGEDGGVVLKFANGEEEGGWDLVVGADGAWSKVRGLVTKVTPRYSGKSFLESRITTTNPLHKTLAAKLGPGLHIAVGGGQLVITQRQGNGEYRTYLGLQIEESFFKNAIAEDQPDKLRATMLDFYADWADFYKDLIRNATNFRAWPLYTLMPEEVGWEAVGDVTLAGDAAHLAITNGEGVNMAMADALALAEKIKEYYAGGDLARAVKEYEADMFPRGSATVKDGWDMSGPMFSDGPGTFLEFMASVGAGGSPPPE
ncbi:FAD/NAD(P)-binding domain-containing protein [Echria macrotheca]|uniref:FAD/NAD(P)-binding domain-containing protein n=1 Tax=Echria macrotheca TaxID=438768 RepID=A0AAJ0BKF2_9PEZI|nr:FAD/NAD(P)-binding domain-containing protein [Echria macrotheca]